MSSCNHCYLCNGKTKLCHVNPECGYVQKNSCECSLKAIFNIFWWGRIYHEGFTLKVIKLKLQGASLAQAPSRAVLWALNKYSLSYLTLYVLFYIIFLKEGPKNCMSFRPQKTWVRPCFWSYTKKTATPTMNFEQLSVTTQPRSFKACYIPWQ